MEDWDLLESLLGAEAWNPPEPPPPAPRLQLRFLLLGAAGLVILLVTVVASLSICAHRCRARSQTKVATAGNVERQMDPARNNRLRDQAAAELRAKIEKLPDKPSATSNVFYYGFWVTMKDSSSPETPWLVTIRGGEDVVDPKTQATLWRSDFTLETDYRQREWTFRHYHATTTNMKEGTTSQVDTEATSGTTPMVVNNIGLKIEGTEQAPRTPPPIVKSEAP